jgi:hypothetical protein
MPLWFEKRSFTFHLRGMLSSLVLGIMVFIIQGYTWHFREAKGRISKRGIAIRLGVTTASVRAGYRSYMQSLRSRFTGRNPHSNLWTAMDCRHIYILNYVLFNPRFSGWMENFAWRLMSFGLDKTEQFGVTATMYSCTWFESRPRYWLS